MYLLGIDIGTTSVKVSIMNFNGELKGLSIQEYSLKTISNTWIEGSVDTYWNACKTGIKEVLDKTNILSNSITGIGISSQGETLICFDNKNNIIRDAIVWLDSRAIEEARVIGNNIQIDTWYKTTGLPEISPMWPICKILWIKNNEPEIFSKTSRFLLLKDYILWKLTGEFITDPTVSSSTGYLDIIKRDWWDDALDILDIRRERLPDIKASYICVGNLTKEAGAEIGLPSGIPVINGGMDQMLSALGAGNIYPGIVTETTGTAMAIIATLDTPTFDPKRRIPCAPHCILNKYVLMPYTETAGIVLKWFRDNFPSCEGKENYEEMLEHASKIPPGSEGLIVIPYFNGSFCPNFDPRARGVFTGVTLKHNRGHFIRAIVESISFMLRENIELLSSFSIPVKKVRSLGGASKSDLWLQIKSDVLNIPIETLSTSETSLLGACIIAGVGIGIFKDVEKTIENIVKVKKTFVPNSKSVSIYDDLYNEYLLRYKKLYSNSESVKYFL